MAIEKFNKNMAIIAALDDEPNDVGGMTSAELKNKFDEGGKWKRRCCCRRTRPDSSTSG